MSHEKLISDFRLTIYDKKHDEEKNNPIRHSAIRQASHR